jgi:hypothetical protein
MDIPMLEYVIAKLQAAKGGWPAIAEGAGISLRTLEKIARREVLDPRIGSVQTLFDYFRALDHEAAA